MVKPIDETGKVYGRLTVIKEIGRKRGAVLFLCHCACENYTEVTGGDLRTGRVNSCGCLKSELRTEKNTTHGLKNHRLYRIYYGMVNRCNNPKVTHYKDYGGRGISVCQQWNDKEDGFLLFYNWSIDNGYEDHLTIDRMDVNGNYEPENCRWATTGEQSLNKRNNHFVKINNEVKTLKEWCDIFNIKYPTVQYRIKSGWDEIKAIITPIDEKKSAICRGVNNEKRT